MTFNDWMRMKIPQVFQLENQKYPAWRNAVEGTVKLMIVCAAVFYLLVVAVFALPQDRVMRELKADSSHGEFDQLFIPTRIGENREDQYTQQTALILGTDPSHPDSSAFKRAIEVPYVFDEPSGKGINGYLNGDKLTTSYHFRYWGGVSVFLRPLVFINGFDAAKLGCFALMLAAAGAWFGLARRRMGNLAALVILGIYFLTTDVFSLLQQPAHAVSQAAIFFGPVIYMLWPDRTWLRRFWAALLAGAVFVFVDYLTNPPVACMILLFTVGAGKLPAESLSWRLRYRLKKLLVAGAGWVVGYAGLWAMKWVIAGLVLGPSRVIASVTEKLRQRSATEGSSQQHGTIGSFIHEAWSKNMDLWLFGQPLTRWIVAGCVVVVVACLIIGAVYASDISILLLVAIPLIVVPVWITVTSEHAAVHFWFTYRMFAMGFAVFVATIVLYSLRGHRLSKNDSVADTALPGEGRKSLA